MNQRNPKDLLLSSSLDFKKVTAILAPVGIKDIKKADTNLQLIADDPRARHLLAEIIEEFLESLSRSPDPDQALNYFERFSRMALNKANLFSYLKDSPYTVWLLAKVFGSSPFMSEVLIRYPHYLYWVADAKTLEESKSKRVLALELSLALKNVKTRERKIERLCIFKHRELLRIGVRDLLEKSSVKETLSALSALAEVVLDKVCRISEEALKKEYGIPVLRKRAGKKVRASFTVLAMGKLGGGELNFSSDVDLLFVHNASGGFTAGSRSGGKASSIPNEKYFKLWSQSIITGLSGITGKGFLYRVDLRLRPEGNSGEICPSLERYKAYYEKRGETWEKMALLKAWPVAGDRSLGKKFLENAARFIYDRPFSLKNIAEVKKIKEMIDHKVGTRGKSHLHVKLGPGGIREIEFIVQSLQIFYGKKYPQIHERQTVLALKKLYRNRLLPEVAFNHLTEGYLFLRKVENSLQMVNESQTHALPDDPEAFRIAALRIDYRDQKGLSAQDQFLRDYNLHTGRIHHLFQELFSSVKKSSLLR